MSEQPVEVVVTDVPDNPIVHFAGRIGAPAAICGVDLTVVGSTYRTRADAGVTCPDCITLLGL